MALVNDLIYTPQFDDHVAAAAEEHASPESTAKPSLVWGWHPLFAMMHSRLNLCPIKNTGPRSHQPVS